MRQENVQYFTEKEEECINLMIGTGTKENVCKITDGSRTGHDPATEGNPFNHRVIV
jgi:hypothetical protein